MDEGRTNIIKNLEEFLADEELLDESYSAYKERVRKIISLLVEEIKNSDNNVPIIEVSGGVVQDVIYSGEYILVDWDNIKGC